MSHALLTECESLFLYIYLLLGALRWALCDSYVSFLRFHCPLSNFLCCDINKELVEIQLLRSLEIPSTKMYRLSIFVSPAPLEQIARVLPNLFNQSVAPSVNHTEWAKRPRSVQAGMPLKH